MSKIKPNQARIQAALNYADKEINAMFLGGPFVVPLKIPGGAIPQEIGLWAIHISGTWLRLSNGTIKDEMIPAKMMRERPKGYAAIGLCKALLRYPADLVRTEARQKFVVTANPPGDDSVDDRLRRQLFEVSYTENPYFRQRFDEYVNELAAIKKKFDPRDTSRDYRLGPQDYLEAANAVIEKYYPSCTECFFPMNKQTLALRDRIEDLQYRIYIRTIGQVPTPDWAKESAEDYRDLYSRVLDIYDTARQLKMQPKPVPPRGSSFDVLYEYLVSMEDSIVSAAPSQADRTTPNLIAGTMAAPLAGEIPAMQKCWIEAYQSFERAVSAIGGPEPSPRKGVWKWLQGHDPDNDYDLPDLATWEKYLRNYHRAMNGPAGNSSRAGRTGRSVVKKDDL